MNTESEDSSYMINTEIVDDDVMTQQNESLFLSIHNEPFYFESDTLALRDNQDYGCLLKTLVLLEAQRVQACDDLEKLMQTKEKALNEPLEFLKHLTRTATANGEAVRNDFEMPIRQNVYLMPDIDWSKYYEYIDITNEDLIGNDILLQKFHSLRRTKRIVEQQQSESTNLQSGPSKRVKRQVVTAEEKIVNYNKSWDVDEQRRLEELLIEFPPEDNEAARWRKIATKLGSRTPLQVQSHCQKFFIKLAKAGLPVPGRMPNLKTYVTKKGTRGGRKGPNSLNQGVRGHTHAKRIVGRGVSLNEISSMLSSFNPPITMNDHEMMDDEDDDTNNYDYDEGDGDEDEGEDEDASQQMNNSNFDDYEEGNEYQHHGATAYEATDSNSFINDNSQSVACKLEPLSFSDSEFNDSHKLDAFLKNSFG